MGDRDPGEFVNSDAAMEDILQRLMNEHPGRNNAPAPASEEAIASLPKRPADAELLGGQTAECPICRDDTPVGTEVVVLPCNHWFHQICAESWLKEHDTCPNCRAGIMPKDGPITTSRRPGQEPLHNEDPVVVARRQSGSRQNPIFVPESPTRDRRLSELRRHSSAGQGSSAAGRLNSRSADDGAPSTFSRVRNHLFGPSNGSRR